VGDEAAQDAAHRARAQKHKEVVDAKIAAAQADKGLLLVLTGNGKGKSSSAFGMVARTLGYGRRAPCSSSSRARRMWASAPSSRASPA
jgi:ATP:corrinoid adenosyltransferase